MLVSVAVGSVLVWGSGRVLWCGGVCRGLVGSVLGGGRALRGSAEGPSLWC